MKKTDQDYGFGKNMPSPRPGKAGRFRAYFWMFVVLLALGASAFWFFNPPEEREKWREKAADTVDRVASGTPLAGIGNIIRNTPPPLPPEITSPATEAGTLSGRQVTGTIASPVETGIPGNPAGGARAFSPGAIINARAANVPGEMERNADTPVFSSEPLPPATEDSKVPPDYLQRVAQWLASRFRNGPNGGTLAFGPQGFNQLCGVTLASQTRGGRDSLLRYVFQPSMLQGLYKLYIDKFMIDLDMAADKRGMSQQENRAFHMALAGRAALAASAMEGILKTSQLGERLQTIEELGRNSVDINAKMSEAVFELDELRQNRNTEMQISTAQMRVDGLASRYRRVLDEYERAQRNLVAEIRKNSGQTMDDESLLFMASWVERRMVAENAREALNSCVEILRDLARRCAAAGEEAAAN